MLTIKWAELHSPIILNGTNLGHKLDCNMRKELSMVYDRNHKELLVTHKNSKSEQTAIVPSTNIVSMISALLVDLNAQHEAAIDQAFPVLQNRTAQVDSPMSHVFAGPGAGKTGKSK